MIFRDTRLVNKKYVDIVKEFHIIELELPKITPCLKVREFILYE